MSLTTVLREDVTAGSRLRFSGMGGGPSGLAEGSTSSFAILGPLDFLALELLFSSRPPSIQDRTRSASFLASLSPLGGMKGSAVWVMEA